MSSGAATTTSKPEHMPHAKKPVRVLIYAETSRTRAELEHLLEPHSNVKVVSAVLIAKELLSAIAEIDPDVVLLQVAVESRGVAWRELHGTGVPLVLLVERANFASVAAAVSDGVQSILGCDVTGVQLATAVVGAANGLFTLASDLADLLRQGLIAHTREEVGPLDLDLPSGDDHFPENLTQREREVLEIMSEGPSNKEIATLLNISTHTVKFHISSILGKLGASSRTEATTIGLRRGLITI